jgi:hypothetical protein
MLGDGLSDLSVVVTDRSIVGSCVSSSARASAPGLSVTPLTWRPALLITSEMLASNSSGGSSRLALAQCVPLALFEVLVGVTEFIVVIPMRATVELVMMNLGKGWILCLGDG